eukprot:CAMPEP_0176157272 /NCGR_PEP_ID=MMETSP0120_2-20121206/80402_1 /TAXON_ID=160619 /ORGANISM="Kryptoperidinium foliaceum, Strain CCMP 1326" /LENGTH=635 /DNA_ID=CAMNT_0017494537 /DNA_START=35 /DNA_END=1945 /DNA_ORIENTATION=+
MRSGRWGAQAAGRRRAASPMGLLLVASLAAPWRASAAGVVSSADCWVGGWTPEICCSAPGAKGNPLCWDHVYTFDKCCTETAEGKQFDLRRRNFVSDMVRRGATVHFDIRHVSGGRTGAVASRTLAARSTVLRVPANQVFSLKSVPQALSDASRRHGCDAHALLALGLALERANPSSALSAWINLLPMSFANVLWFSERQLQLVNSTFFSYIVNNWFGDLECMRKAADEIPSEFWRGRQVGFEDLRWALSVVKTRGFAFEGTRESTMLIPLADFLNHNRVASVRTATLAEDALRFVATKTVLPGEELCIDYAQASNLEFLVRYGFRVEDNPYGGRQFDLGGEPLQAHCPSYILRYDTPDIIENITVDCHRQARYLSFEQQFGTLQPHEQLREDRYIYSAVEEACKQLLSMLEAPRPLSEYETDAESGGVDGITAVLVREIRAERALLTRCAFEFQKRQQETVPRPVPSTLAEPLARLRGVSMTGAQSSAAGAEAAGPSFGMAGTDDIYSSGPAGAPSADGGGVSGVGSAAPRSQAFGMGSAYTTGPIVGAAGGQPLGGYPAFGSAGSPMGGAAAATGRPIVAGGMDPGRPAASAFGAPEAAAAAEDAAMRRAFAPTGDRARVDQLLQRLQQGVSI